MDRSAEVRVSPQLKAPAALVVDDHDLFAVTLCMALREQGVDARRAIVDSAESIRGSARENNAGLIVLDLYLGTGSDHRRIDVTELTRALRADGWNVLLLSGAHDDEATAAAVAAGAIGYTAKSSAFDEITHVIRTALTGRPVMTDGQRLAMLELHHDFQSQRREIGKLFERLSADEVAILALLAQGGHAARIADHLNVPMTTFRTQIRAILTKLECGSQVEAVALARRHTRNGPLTRL